jgi:hypothetical protein
VIPRRIRLVAVARYDRSGYFLTAA